MLRPEGDRVLTLIWLLLSLTRIHLQRNLFESVMIYRDHIIYDFKIPAGMADKEEGQDRLDFCLHVSVRCTFPATHIMKPIHALPHPLINSDYKQSCCWTSKNKSCSSKDKSWLLNNHWASKNKSCLLNKDLQDTAEVAAQLLAVSLPCPGPGLLYL